jgi:AraC-like DNA-binding protein
MFYQRYIPAAPLSNFVELFWLYGGYQQPHEKERLLPTGTTEIVIDLRDNQNRVYDRDDLNRFQTYDGPIICGPHSEHFVIDTAGQAYVMGIHFKPGGAFPFISNPLNELHNTHLSLSTLWGLKANDMRDRLLEAEAPEEKFKVLEECLLAQAVRPLVRHPAVAFALKELHNVPSSRTISNLTDEIGLSARRFIQIFSAEVGLTPKLFCRVRRFQEVLRIVQTQSDIDWVDIAIGCGYFDQAHFIRDFKAFSGINPSVYVVNKSEHLNHVPIL